MSQEKTWDFMVCTRSDFVPDECYVKRNGCVMEENGNVFVVDFGPVDYHTTDEVISAQTHVPRISKLHLFEE